MRFILSFMLELLVLKLIHSWFRPRCNPKLFSKSISQGHSFVFLFVSWFRSMYCTSRVQCSWWIEKCIRLCFRRHGLDLSAGVRANLCISFDTFFALSAYVQTEQKVTRIREVQLTAGKQNLGKICSSLSFCNLLHYVMQIIPKLLGSYRECS